MKIKLYDRIEHIDILGRSHRNNGPAVVWYNGKQVWCKHGKLHRVDGPAIVNVEDDSEDTVCEYWIDGIQYSEEDFKFIQWCQK